MPAIASRPFRLDCSSPESTYIGLRTAYGCTQQVLQRFLLDASHASDCDEDEETLLGYDEWFFERARERLGQPILPTEVCWFHGTRLPVGTSFEQGLLPLGPALASLQTSVIGALTDPAAQTAVDEAFKRDGWYSTRFCNRRQHPEFWGPCALMVREVADHPAQLRMHDYLAMPEILDDLCKEVQRNNGLDIRADLAARWVPAIVKFYVAVAGSDAEVALEVALCYASSSARNELPSFGATRGFDGKNSRIPPERILEIEWVRSPR